MSDDKKKKSLSTRGKDLSAICDLINAEFESDIGTVASNMDKDGGPATYMYPTGILSLDKYLSTGGMFGGRIINSFGWNGCGKTLTALTVAASIQRTPCDNPSGFGRVCFLDSEGSLSLSMAKAVGVDTDKMIVYRSTPERILTGEDYFNLIKLFIQAGIELIIVDSAPALVPSQRMEATIGVGQKATHANLMSEGLQQCTPLLNGFKRSVLWFINQIRMKPMEMFGKNNGSTGGEALKFYASYSMEVKKIEDIIKKVQTNNGSLEEQRIGVTVQLKLEKNKTAAIPVEPIQFDIFFKDAIDDEGITYQTGVDIYKDMVNTGILSGVVKQASSHYSFGDIKGNGVANLIKGLKLAGPEVLQDLRNKVLGK